MKTGIHDFNRVVIVTESMLYWSVL